jgi:heptosyltransferase-1
MKILILKVSAIGDVIHALPAIFYLKKCCPDVQLSWVVQKKAADLILNQPYLDKVFVLPNKFLHPKNWLKTFKVIRELRQIKWDAIIDFQGIHKTSLLISILRGKKFGFDAKLARSKFSTWFTHEQVSQEPNLEFKNIIQKNLALADYVARALCRSSENKPTGIYANQCPSIAELKKSFVFKFDQAGIDMVDEWLEKNISKPAKYILLCPNTTWQTKHWPEEYWLELIKILSQDNLQYKILLVGQDFGQAAKQIAQSCIGQALPVHIVPAWDLNATAYLISKADLLIAPDTGLLHLADFLDTTTIGIFGPTGKDAQGPFLKDINMQNAIQISDKMAIHVNDSAVNDSSNNPNLKKATAYQSNMYKLKPNVLAKKVLQILKNQN